MLGCEYVTADVRSTVDAAVAASLFLIHINMHLTGSVCSQKKTPQSLTAQKYEKAFQKKHGMPSYPNGTCSKKVLL